MGEIAAAAAHLRGKDPPTEESLHVLNDEWTFYLNERPPKGISQEEYERSIHKWGVFSTIEGFWRHMNALDIQKLPNLSTLRMFKSSIKPSWEDPANCRGGKYVLDSPKNTTPRLWRRLVLAIIGGTLSFSDQICGVVLSVRPHKDALQIWNRDTEEIVCLEDSLRELREVMGIDDEPTINYQAHSGSLNFNSHILERKNSPRTQKRGSSNGQRALSQATSNGHTRHGHQENGDSVDVRAHSTKSNGNVQRKENDESDEAKSCHDKQDNIQQKEAEDTSKEKDIERSISWGDIESEEENEEIKSATEIEGDKREDEGYDSKSETRSIDWAELAEEGEDEVSDTSWLTEDDSEDQFTPYESENDETFDGFEPEQYNRPDNGNEKPMDEASRVRSSFRDLQSKHTRSLSRDRGWHDGSGSQWQRTNIRQSRNPLERGHKKNGSVGKQDYNSSIRKSMSNADIGPKKFKTNNSFARSNSITLQEHPSNSYSPQRHKRSTSETMQDNPSNRLYHSQDKMRGRRLAAPPGFTPANTAQKLAESSPLSTIVTSPRTGLKLSTKRTAVPPAPATNPWKGAASLPASILPHSTPKPVSAAANGVTTASRSASALPTPQKDEQTTVESTPPPSPRQSDSGPTPTPAPSPSTTHRASAQAKESSTASSSTTPRSSTYAAACVDPKASSETTERGSPLWKPKDRMPKVNTGGKQAYVKREHSPYNKAKDQQSEVNGKRIRSPQGRKHVPANVRDSKPEDNSRPKATSLSSTPEGAKKPVVIPPPRSDEVTATSVSINVPTTSTPSENVIEDAVPTPQDTSIGSTSTEKVSDQSSLSIASSQQIKTTTDPDIPEPDAAEPQTAVLPSEELDVDSSPENLTAEPEQDRRTPKIFPRRKQVSKKTPKVVSKRPSAKRTSHRRSQGLIIDFLKAHEQAFYLGFASLMVLLLVGTILLLGTSVSLLLF